MCNAPSDIIGGCICRYKCVHALLATSTVHEKLNDDDHLTTLSFAGEYTIYILVDKPHLTSAARLHLQFVSANYINIIIDR